MRRRALLARFGAAATVLGAGGCLADGERPPTENPPRDDTTAPSPTDEPNGTTPDGTDTPTGTATAPPETPPHDAEFPHGRDDVDEIVWHREVSDPDSSLVLEHFAAEATLPADLDFRLSNGTDRTFHTNFYNWSLHRWEGGRWHRVAPTMVNDPLMSVPPGESHEWTLTLENEGLDDPLLRSEGTEEVTVCGVGGGSYAFAAEGWWEDQDRTPSYEHKTVLAARFVLDAPALGLTPSSAVTETRRDGDRVVVKAQNPRDEDGEADHGTYALEAVEDADASEAHQVITEQAYRHWPLRDALAQVGDDVREVRIDTTTTITPAFGVQDDAPPVAYDGQVYRVSAARAAE